MTTQPTARKTLPSSRDSIGKFEVIAGGEVFRCETRQEGEDVARREGMMKTRRRSSINTQ